MCFKFQVLLLLSTAPYFIQGVEVKDKRQVASIALQKEDHQGSETGFVGGGPAAIHAGSKYFQYAHVPTKDHYEHGHKRGNEHHFIERHEKAHPHAGEFKTKVRWGDKHGGYGEHYWDYNHAGHHDGDGEESQQNEEYAAYEESQQVPQKYVEQRRKRQPSIANDDVEFINDNARSLVQSGLSGAKHGGNYKSERDFERGKREQQTKRQRINGKNVVFDQEAQLLVDKESGIAYELKPVDY